MTFRPSVVPDRDNDIISTFTRSFERARNLVRQDQASAREEKAFAQETRLRQFDIEDREFEAAIRRTEPGVTPAGRPAAFPIAAAEPISQAFVQPNIPGVTGDLGIEVPDFTGGREEIPGVGGVGVVTEPARRGGVPLPGGGTFSRSLARSIRAAEEEEDIRRRAGIEFDLPEARAERAEEERETIIGTRERQAEINRREGQASAFRNLFPTLADITDDDTVIAQGEVLAQQQLRRTPTGASIVSAAGRADRATANVLAVFERKLAAARSLAGRTDPTPVQRREAIVSGEAFDPFSGIDPALLMEETITEALTAGTITPDQAQTMQGNVQDLLTQAGQSGGGTAGPLSPEDVEFFLDNSGGGTIEEQSARWRMDGLDEQEIAQLVAAAGGR